MLTIALGIGATAAIFSVVNAVLLRPLPYTDAARLGTVWGDMRNRNVVDFPISPGDFFDLQTTLTQLDGIVGLNTFRPTIGGDGQGDSEQVVGAGATTNIFTMLGHRIHLGRNFVPEDGTPQAAPPLGDAVPAPGAAPPPLPNIAILSYEFWKRRYGGDERIVGKSIEFGNGRAEIVGVLAPRFELLFPPGTNIDPRPDIVVANRVNYETGPRNNVFLRAIARLKPGVTFEQAQAELDRLSADLRARFPIKHTAGSNFRIEFTKTPIIAGRAFTEADNKPAAKVVIIDDLMAAQLFPNGNAIGQRMLARVTTPEPDTFEIIRISKHQRHTTMMSDGEEGMFFTDGYAQFGAAFRWAVRTSGDPNAITGALRSALAQHDARLLLTETRTWRSFFDEHVAPTRFALILIGVFAGVAAILAMIGLYGVLATTVRQRTTEIGVRMAFGATQGSILSLIIGQGLRLSIGGIVLGVIAAIALTRVMASLLVGVTATDPVTFAGMAGLFTLVAAFAAWIPARRAAALNPNVALRDGN